MRLRTFLDFCTPPATLPCPTQPALLQQFGWMSLETCLRITPINILCHLLATASLGVCNGQGISLEGTEGTDTCPLFCLRSERC